MRGGVAGGALGGERQSAARVAREAQRLLDDIDKDTVDFQPNYDESENEPKVRPAA